MIKSWLFKWFGKDNWKATAHGLLMIICTILYAICDDHTDKILTAVMTILAHDFFTRNK